ncbi:glycoside hydrolase family 16 protein [Nocardioides sp. YIM 152315]|uniref:glycoside hydrolase family 16 protein n=1 Tax=Nocardioides sp. YIM 152315 TaxID=3031760 RepID=UPI0023DA4256|nr:glycoside hydrolase family 16 protein [Nocardioides sp. YIM 152315]MDF1602313.1 glycoside hydrolase family 16 protein [Nocardioides sp. YIM 152315]
MHRSIVVTAASAVVVAVAVVSVVTVVWEGNPRPGPGPEAAHTQVRVSAPQTRMPGETFRVRGVASVEGASFTGLPVGLQRQDATGAWSDVGEVDTVHHGHYAFPEVTLDQFDGTSTFRTYVDPGLTDEPVYSDPVQVRYVPQTVRIEVQPRLIAPGVDPEALSVAAARAVVTVSPARAERPIDVYVRAAGSQDAWQPMTSLTTDDSGQAYFRAWGAQEYRAVAHAWHGVAEATSLSAELADTPAGAPTFVDEFDTFDPAKWVDRPGQDVYGVAPQMMCEKASAAARSVANGVLTLGVLPDPEAPGPCTSADPADGQLQHLLQGHVQTTSFTQARGWFVARVKFQTARAGSYGAFWLSAEGYGRGRAEVDVAEFNGRTIWGDSITANWDGDGSPLRSSPQKFAFPSPLSGAEYPVPAELQSPSEAFHVYAVHWTHLGYDFYYDGNLVASLQDQSAYKPSRVILSNLTRDWNQKNMRDLSDPEHAVEQQIYVDWVAVYED